MMASKRNIAELDILRTLGNVLIVFVHCATLSIVLDQQIIGAAERRFIQFWCYTLAWQVLPVFFFISGFLMMRGYSARMFGDKLRSRVRRLLLPYLCWNLLFAVWFATMWCSGLSVPSEPIWKYVCMLFGFIFRPLDGPLWYVRALMIWLMLLPLIYGALNKKLLRIVLVLIAALYMIVVPCLFPRAQRAFLTTFPPYSVGVFLWGAYLAYRNIDLSNHFRRWFGVYAGAGCVAWLIQLPLGLNSIAIDMRGLLYVVIVFLLPQSVLKKVEVSPIYRTLAMSSFFLYAAHKLPCFVSHYMLQNLLPKYQLAAYSGATTVIMFLEVALIVLCCCKVCMWLNKWFPRLGYLLSGRA